jgi:predicted nucleic acid-binding protein
MTTLPRPVPPLLVLDACCAINLLASARESAILAALPYRCGVVERVLRDEVLRVGDPESAAPRTLQPLCAQGLLEVLDLEGEEEEATFITLARNLDDGEAATGALAFHRSAILATDDAKALRILTGEPYRLEVVGTPWMIEHWSRTGVSPSEVREALLRIQEVGRFLPPKRDPLREWWRAMAGE